MYLQSFVSVLYCAIVSVNAIKNDTGFSASVFIFFDEGNRLTLNNEITTLEFWCSGCIIESTWALTAASCFSNREKVVQSERFIVVPTKGATVFENSTGLKSYEVEKIILDQNWKSKVNDVNIALLLLKDTFGLTNKIAKATLASHAVKTKAHCTSLVWMREPSKESKDIIFMPHLLSGQIDFECRRKYKNEFCFISKVDDESCYDIQGSILICNNRLQGIASSKHGGANPLCTDKRNSTYLNVFYIDIGKFNTWIRDNIDKVILAYNQSKLESKADNKIYDGKFSKLFEFLLFILLCNLVIE